MEGVDIDNETLMDCIHNYPAIYDKSCKDYKIPLRKKNAWKQVCMKLGMELEIAQKRYTSIRTMFSKYVKHTKFLKSGSGREDVPEIRQDLKYLGWLKCRIKTRGSITNFQNKKRNTSTVLVSEINSVCSRSSDSEDEEDIGEQEVRNNAHLMETDSQEDKKESNEFKPLESADKVDESIESSAPSITPPPVIEKPKASISSNLEAPETPMVPKKSKKNAWSKSQKSMHELEIDRQFISTMHNMNKAISNYSASSVAEKNALDNDEHFFLSLVGHLHALEPRYKTMAKIQIMKVFNDIEWMKAPQPHNQTASGYNYMASNPNPYGQQNQPLQQLPQQNQQHLYHIANVHKEPTRYLQDLMAPESNESQ